MRGADDAGGHAAELMDRGPRAFPDRARAFAGDVAEGRPNVPRLCQPVSKAISVIGRSVSRSSAVARSIRRVSR